jgi:mitogen-activated protein kinase organizer 1
LTGSSDRLVRLFNPAKASIAASSNGPQSRPAGLVQTYTGHAHEVLDIAVSDDNARFISVGGDKQALLWDVAQARVLRRFEGHTGRINACSWAGDGREQSVVITGEIYPAI